MTDKPQTQTTRPDGPQPDMGAWKGYYGLVIHENEALRQLIARVMVGGNHLASHIDANGPNWRASYDEGMNFYGAGLRYDAWCCWKTIMLIREDMKRV